MPHRRDTQIARRITAWFRQNARPLPWRTPPPPPLTTRRDPYAALVSEAMLQQTQASRVAERFPRFLARFPTIHHLAHADEDDVLALWSGLGYYSRAKSLHKAAKAIVSDHDSRVPHDTHLLRKLPGVGRYTAAAIASIVYNRPEPIADANVARVLLRLDARPGHPSEKPTSDWIWSRAAQLVSAADDPAPFNEGLMELGATLCTARSPDCPRCPLAETCRARSTNQQNAIPSKRPAQPRSALYCASVRIHDSRSRLALEQRPRRGMWAGLWQAPTLERTDHPPTRAQLQRHLNLKNLKHAHTFEHLTTHRRVIFHVWSARADARSFRPNRWIAPGDLHTIALSAPQRRILLENPSAAPATHATTTRSNT